MLSADYSSNGTFTFTEYTAFFTEIAGRVTRVLVKREFDFVHTGQTIATIKNALELIILRSSQSNLSENTVVDNQRYENAYKTGGVTNNNLTNPDFS